MKTILLFSDWDGLLFWLNEDFVNTGPVDVAQLPTSDRLRSELREFNRWHDELCYSDDGAPSPLDKRLYDDGGLTLWEQLQKELGSDYRVYYPSQEFGRELEDCPEKLRAAQKREPYA